MIGHTIATAGAKTPIRSLLYPFQTNSIAFTVLKKHKTPAHAFSVSVSHLAHRKLESACTTGFSKRRHFHSMRVVFEQGAKDKEQGPEIAAKPASSTAVQQPDTSAQTRLPMYDMPMSKQVRNLRMVFLVNVFCSTAISLWVRLDDIYTVFAAGAIMTAGFIPLALVQLMYRDHIRSIRILGNINKGVLQRLRRSDPENKSQIEYPVTNDTPLLLEKFSLTGSDPKTPLYVRDLTPGPSRKYSVQWLYKPEYGRQVGFRVSKKVIQYHPDVRALDALIRENAELGITSETSAKQAKKLRKKQQNR
ncbi:hypothetical protein LPJ64_001543 [Coemansia asiatica]|uniref:Transmembrane protein n=1 Tax=Coemansia asiatica TaxID=1052880 RepID=A0A9W7XQD4_9FUNG|nr:hypothetical protein LPJ64_001543 [Coemansia asiatica]